MPITYLEEEPVKAIPAKRKITYLDEPTTPFLPGEQKVEKMISQRPDILSESNPQLYDFGTLMFTPLKLLSGLFQRGEATVAGAGLEAQKLSPGWQHTEEQLRGRITPEEERLKTKQRFQDVGRIAKAAWKGIIGQRPAELGDLIRTTGVGGEMNEFLAAPIGFFGMLGLTNLVSKGKLIESSKKAGQVLKSKLPARMDKNYAIDRARKASSGLDELYDGLSSEYDDMFRKVGGKEVDAAKVSEVLSDLPENIVKRVGSSVGQNAPANINTLQKIKGVLRKAVPKWAWSGRQIATPEQGAIKNAYYRLQEIAAEGSDELMALNKKYAQFRRMQETLSGVLHDAQGNVRSKGVENLFKPGAERVRQQFFEKFAEQWPQARQIMKDMIKFNKRQAASKMFRQFNKEALKWGAIAGGAGAGGYYGAKTIGQLLE